MSLQTTALENTSIKVGPARKVSCKAKMARRSKKSRKKDGQDRYVSAGAALPSVTADLISTLDRKDQSLLEVLLKASPHTRSSVAAGAAS